MLSIILLVHLSISNAQWPEQNIGRASLEDAIRMSNQSEPPYNDMYQNLKDIGRYDQRLLRYEDIKTPNTPEEGVAAKLVEKVNVVSKARPWLIDDVKQMVESNGELRNRTDQLIRQLEFLHSNVEVRDFEDTEEVKIFKYSMSVVVRFLLEFYRIFRRLLNTQSSNNQINTIDVYNKSYDEAVYVMKSKKNYTPMEISAPVKRSIDIFKSILYESVQIVQAECKATVPPWQCGVLYLANLIRESNNCPNVWYHAFIHFLALRFDLDVEKSFVHMITSLPMFKQDNPFNRIFDFVMDIVEQFKDVGRDELSTEAMIFTLVADLQEIGLLDCMSVDLLYN